MKVFVTGASGHVGSIVVAELLAAGHEVIGLARSDETAQRLVTAGVTAHRGSLDDVNSLQEAVNKADGVIHLAFRHDLAFTGKMAKAANVDLAALGAMADVLEGTQKPLIAVNGTLGFSSANPGHTITENDTLPSGPRIESENFVISLSERGIRSAMIRLSPTVHGPRDNVSGFIPTLIRIAREKGTSAYVTDGSNRWPAVHELDAGVLFRLAIENASAGSRLHAVADEGVAFKDIAQAIGDHLNIPTESISKDEAAGHFGHLAYFATIDNPTSGQQTQAALNWRPTQAGLIDDLAQEHYFESE